jgi:hypothetical protein
MTAVDIDIQDSPKEEEAMEYFKALYQNFLEIT